jgi:hypothetical protein
MCARCNEPILPGEKALPVDKLSPSGGGSTLHVHAVLCRRPPTQTSPVGASGARRGEAGPTPRAGRP